MTISEARKVWAKKVNGLLVTQQEIMEARKTYEETIEEWHKLDDYNREMIGDQEMLKVINDDPKVKEVADKLISQYKKARELAFGYIKMYEEELGNL